MSAKKSLLYKGTRISPGSNFYQLLEELEKTKSSDLKKQVEVEFKRLDDEFHKHFPRDLWSQLTGKG